MKNRIFLYCGVFVHLVVWIFSLDYALSMENVFMRSYVKSFDIKDITIKRTHFSEISSTQLYSTSKVVVSPEKNNNWYLVTANTQTSDDWVSEDSGNVYASVCLPCDMSIVQNTDPFCVEHNIDNNVKLFAQISALSVLYLVKSQLGPSHKVDLNLPGDVKVNGKKISNSTASIVQIPGTRVGQCTINLRLNVNMNRKTVSTIDQATTSLAVEAGHAFDNEKMLNLYLENLITLLE